MRRCIWFCVCLLVAASVGSPARGEEPKPKQEDTHASPDWSLLDFQDDYRLTKVRLEVRKNTGENYQNGKVVVNLEFTEKDDLKLFMAALESSRLGVPRKNDAAWGLTPNAMLECATTTRDTFRIYWNDTFVLNEETPSSNFIFTSLGLALAIDAKLRAHGHEGYEESFLRGLSGERQLAGERARITKLINGKK